MNKSAVFLLGLWTASVGLAAPLTDEPVAELRLTDGEVLKDAVARSYSATTVLLKHAGGAAVVKYGSFPEEYREALTAKRDAAGRGDASGPDGEKSAAEERPELAAASYEFPAPPAVEVFPSDERIVAGQVFVTTTDAGDVKLGNVRVSVYSKGDYREQTAWYNRHPWEASRTHSRNAEVLAKSGDNVAAMNEFEAATATAALGWMLVAPAQFSTVTDAEGRFTLKHGVPPPYFVVAHASRWVEGEIENYRWAVISDLIDEPENLLLFNDNME